MLNSHAPSGKYRSAPSRPTAERLEGRTLLATVPSGFQYADFVTGLVECTSMTFAPDGRIFYTEKSGAVRVVKNGQVLANTLVRVSVDGYFERGLQCITLDPGFATNGVFYLYYTRRDPDNPNTSPNNAKNRISRFKIDPANPDRALAGSEVVVLDNIPADSGYHNGGAMVFGADGNMYVGTGEVGLPSISDATTRAQDLSTLAGKILRINPRQGAQLIPGDNPFVGQSGKRAEIYSYGIRNPFTMGVKPGTNLVYANDVGSWQYEEINEVKKGANYGFPHSEGYSTNSAYTSPVYAYSHASTGNANGQAAITGGTFYTGNKFPSSYLGKYFFADYVNKFIKVFDPAVPRQATTFATGTNSLIDLDVGTDGNLYGLSHTVGSTNARIVKISYVGSGQNRAPTAVSMADKTSGPLPLTVNFFATDSFDPDNDTLTYSWNFGDGTTLTTKNPTKTYTTKGTYNAVLTVSDGRGGTDSADPIVVSPGNNAPVITFTSPANDSLYQGSQQITYSANATDAEDGTLAASKFDWTIVLHHQTHDHPFLDDIDGVKSGSFTIPVDVEVDPVQFYRIHLKVKDSAGVQTESFVDIKPRTSTFTLASNVSGIAINLDGQPKTAGTQVLGVVGTRRRIEAPAFQTVNGTSYEFVSWSDSGAASHDIFTPTDNTTYTATYKVATTVHASRTAAAAAYVRDGTYAGQNFGTATDLIVKKSANAGNTRESYVRFSISDFNNIAAATLRLFGQSSVGTQNVPLAVYAVANVTWSETGITWNTRPGAGTQLASKTIAGTTGQWHEFDVSQYVSDQRAAGATAVSFVVKAIGTTDAQALFNSDENASNKPALLVQYSPTQAPTPTLLAPIADTYARDGGSAATNFGSSTELQLKKNLTGSNREIWLKFDLTSVSSVTSAKVRLFGRIDSATETQLVQAFGGSSSWTETGLTWNTRPSASTSALSSQTVATTGPKWYEWDVTGYLQAEKAAGRNLVTIVLRTATTTTPHSIFASDEAAANRPQLQVLS